MHDQAGNTDAHDSSKDGRKLKGGPNLSAREMMMSAGSSVGKIGGINCCGHCGMKNLGA